MKLKHLLALSLIPLLIVGCVHVPSNTLTFSSKYGSLELSHPQNTDMTNVTVDIYTNGSVHASIGSLHTVNSPAVISAEAAGEVAKLQAMGDIGAKVTAAAVSAAK